MAQHTETPWFETGGFIVYRAPNGMSCPLFEITPITGEDGEIRVNLDFLFRACNSHDALVAALAEAAEAFDRCADALRAPSVVAEQLRKEAEQCRAALIKATGKGE